MPPRLLKELFENEYTKLLESIELEDEELEELEEEEEEYEEFEEEWDFEE